jgi:hypothetical protein
MNERYYGRAISAEAIILRREVEAPNAALLQDALRRAEASSG